MPETASPCSGIDAGEVLGYAHAPTKEEKQVSESDRQATLPGLVESVEVSFTRAKAIQAATRLKPLLLKHVLRAKNGRPLCRLAGSLRRRVRHVHDIDIVACVSRTPDDLMATESNPRARLRANMLCNLMI